MQYAKSLPAQEGDGGHAAELQRQNEANKLLLNNPGTENPFKLWRELGDTMTKHATIVRYNAGLDEADAKIVELPRPLQKRPISPTRASGPTPASPSPGSSTTCSN